MASSPSKRRKLSPMEPAPPSAPATPSRIPVPQGDARTLPARPSFASPTKASLARFNPQLLGRPRSAGSGDGRPSSRGSTLYEGAAEPGLVPQTFSQVPELGSERVVAEVQTPSIETEYKGQATLSSSLGLSAPPRRRSRTPGKTPTRTLHVLDEPIGTGKAVNRDIFLEALRSADNPAETTFEKRVDNAPGILHRVDRTGEAGIQDGLQSSAKTFQPVNSPTRAMTGAKFQPFDSLAAESDSRGSQSSDPSSKTRKSGFGTRNAEIATLPPAPFRSRGLRRSPVGPQAMESLPAQEMRETRELPSQETRELPSQVMRELPSQETRELPSQETRELPSQETRELPSQETQELPSQAIRELPPNEIREPAEPELPLTPTQRGLQDPVVTTPPSGIHNSPSKRPKRTRVSKPRPSPLKPRLEPVLEPGIEQERPEKRGKEELASRHLTPLDPHAEKKKRRDQLLLEVQRLQSDIALAENENARLRQHSLSGKGAAGEPPNADDILGLILHLASPPAPSKSIPKNIFQNIGAFLPFSAKRRPTQSAPPGEAAPLSHLPIVLQDPLPYLEAFTPLKFSSTITILPTDPSTPDILQTHAITASAPSGLFSSRFSMTVNTTFFSIAKLTVDKLDPSAEAELGQWARDRASGQGPLGRDVVAICWAMQNWVEVATRRAKFWYLVESELGTEEARKQTREKLSVRGKRKRRSLEAIEEEEDTEAGQQDQTSAPKKWTRVQLLLHMQRMSMILVVGDGVELDIKWSIQFDWTGEGESSISANVRMLKDWQEQDERGSLAKLPATFDKLVKKQGPLAATKAIVSLLMA